MIQYNIRKYIDNGVENFLQIEIIKPNQFNNDIIDIDETYDSLFEIYILLKSDDADMIQDYLNDLIQIDDSPYRRGEN